MNLLYSCPELLQLVYHFSSRALSNEDYNLLNSLIVESGNNSLFTQNFSEHRNELFTKLIKEVIIQECIDKGRPIINFNDCKPYYLDKLTFDQVVCKSQDQLIATFNLLDYNKLWKIGVLSEQSK